MKTSVIEVRDMLSILSLAVVEERIRDVPGVESAVVKLACGTATVRYDETRLDIHGIKSALRQDEIEAEGESSFAHGTAPVAAISSESSA